MIFVKKGDDGRFKKRKRDTSEGGGQQGWIKAGIKHFKELILDIVKELRVDRMRMSSMMNQCMYVLVSPSNVRIYIIIFIHTLEIVNLGNG